MRLSGRIRKGAIIGAIVCVALVAGGCGSASPSIDPAGPPVPKMSGDPVGPTGSASPQAAGQGTAKLQPPPTPYLQWSPDPIPLKAWVTPACIAKGGVATLHVETVPEARIGYEAVYSDRGGGSIPPYGHGYGGNDKGIADSSGRWSNSWTVSVKAPSGPGRVNVIVASRDGQSYAGPLFAIADASGHC
jgi:hypothetical protein